LITPLCSVAGFVGYPFQPLRVRAFQWFAQGSAEQVRGELLGLGFQCVELALFFVGPWSGYLSY
jgi:hypothetical protein